MAIGTRDLNNVLARINSKLACNNVPLLHFRSGYGKLGVNREDESNLSALLTRPALYAYLLAFEDGLDYCALEIKH